MNTHVKKVGLAIAALGLAGAGYVSVAYFLAPPVTEKHYATYAAAVTGNAVADHWLPDFVPKSATNLHVRYGLDPSFLELEFSYDVGDGTHLTAGFEQLDEARLGSLREVLNGRRWQQPIPQDALLYTPTFGDASADTPLLALDMKAGQAWYLVN